MSHRRSHRSAGADFDISPLIDVVFILLIFFMVSTTFVKDMQLDLERPGAQSAVPAKSDVPRVAIDAGGGLHVEGVAVRPWMLQSRVQDLLAAGDTDSVLVVVDRRVPAEKLVEVVDQCRLAGAKNVGVITDKEAG
jgi:biopolymer transport protein ExbD